MPPGPDFLVQGAWLKLRVTNVVRLTETCGDIDFDATGRKVFLKTFEVGPLDLISLSRGPGCWKTNKLQSIE